MVTVKLGILLRAWFNKPLAIHANLYMALIFMGLLYRQATYMFVTHVGKPLIISNAQGRDLLPLAALLVSLPTIFQWLASWVVLIIKMC